jgi:hypothetical protein
MQLYAKRFTCKHGDDEPCLLHFPRDTKMAGKTLFLVPLLLLAAGTARAQSDGIVPPWSAWQPATTPAGAALSTVQYRWRSTPPCAAGKCQLAVQLRNTGDAPAQFHYSIYFDAPAPQSKGTTQSITGDASLKALVGSSGTVAARDTTASRIVTGTRISRVVVEMKGDSARSYTWGPYQYDIMSSRNTSDPSRGSTFTVSESIQLSNGVVTITETRSPAHEGSSVVPLSRKYSCTFLTARTKMKWLDQKTAWNDYLPSPLWEVDLTCKEGATAVVFPVAKDAASFGRLINGVKKH